MRISELLQKESIALGRKPQDKADAIGQMVELLAKSGSLEDKKKFKQAILERERLSTTGIGEGIAHSAWQKQCGETGGVGGDGCATGRGFRECGRCAGAFIIYDCGA